LEATDGADQIFNLAADMGGMGFIENNKVACMLSSVINTNLLVAAREHGIERFFLSSAACVYAAGKQTDPKITGLAEADGYPTEPEYGYGWENLVSERKGRHFMEDFGLEFSTAHKHIVYGLCGTWDNGREKAPAAICPEVITQS